MTLKRPSAVVATVLLVSAFAAISEFSLLIYALSLTLLIVSVVVFFLKMRRAAVFVLLCAFVSLYPFLYGFCGMSGAMLSVNNNRYTATVEKISYGQSTNELYLSVDTGRVFPSKVNAVAVTDSISEDIRLYDRISFDGQMLVVSDENTGGVILKKPCISYISEGYYAAFEIKNPMLLETESRHPAHLFYRYMTNKLNGKLPDFYGTDGFSYTIALLTGDRGGIPAKTYDSFVRSGFVPFLCISGLHVVIACSVLARILDLLKPGKALRNIILLCFLFVIVMITGGGAPVMRAAIMSAILILLTAFNYKSDSLSVLFTTFCLMSFANPFFIFAPGSALSFLATAGIYCMNASGNSYRTQSRLHNYIADGLHIGFFAAGFTMPVMVCVFGGFNLLSPVSNFAASLVFIPLMYLLVILAALAFLPGVFLAPITFCISCLVKVFEKCSDIFASVPFAYAEPVFAPQIVVMLAALGSGALISAFSGKRRTVFVCGFIYAGVSYVTAALLWFLQ